MPNHANLQSEDGKEPRSSTKWIFLLSPPRSGSTLLRTILSEHDKICGVHECKIVYALFCKFGAKPRIVSRDSLQKAVLETRRAEKVFGNRVIDEAVSKANLQEFDSLEFCKSLVTLRCQKSQPAFVIDKNIGYHEIFDTLRQIPESRFIVLVRNPLAAVSSLKQKKMGVSTFSRCHYEPNSLAELAFYFRRTLPLLQGILSSAEKAQVQFVRYEDLVKNPELEVARLCEWLEIEFQPEMLKFYRQSNRKINLPKDSVERFHENIRKPIVPELADNWKTKLTDREKQKIEDIVGSEALGMFGYQPECRSVGKLSLLSRIGLHIKVSQLNRFRVVRLVTRRLKRI